MSTASAQKSTQRSWLAPTVGFLVLLVLWELITRYDTIPAYILPGPIDVSEAIVQGWEPLAHSWWFTMKITLGALALACLGGVLIAVVFSLMPYLEKSLTPLVVMLQVTPVVAIAPLIMVYVNSTNAALLICAWLVAFFSYSFEYRGGVADG
ncbi:MAG: hypothetical protein LRY56_01695 [Burkholderiaceae bacterium]|nr:hypothetical protein [Burkholderiaceae bacterium]